MSNLKQDLENSFSGVESFGFSSPIKFVDATIAVGIRKDFEDNSASGIKIGILRPTDSDVDPLHISVTHGKKEHGGIVLRKQVGLTEPIDLYSSPSTGERFFSPRSLYLKDRFYYDKVRGVFLKNSREIPAHNVVKEVFEKHTRTTKPIRGVLLRLRLWFWQLALPWVFYAILYNIFRYLLLLISGDHYTYNFLEGKGETSKESRTEPISQWRRSDSDDKRLEPKEEESEQMDIFGYKLSQHSAFVYSLFSLGLYLFFSFYQGHLPVTIEIISESTIATLFYIIVTLHIFDKWLPFVLKLGIDVVAKTAFYLANRPVAV